MDHYHVIYPKNVLLFLDSAEAFSLESEGQREGQAGRRAETNTCGSWWTGWQAADLKPFRRPSWFGWFVG